MHSKPLFIILWLWLLVTATPAQEPFTLTAASLQNGQAVELDKLGWKYSPGDDPQFADPQFDDRAWETLNGTAITLDSIPKSGWRGLGWFRLRLQVDPTLASQPLALVMVHFGASEIYLDGKLVERFGTVGATPETEVEYNPNTLPFGSVLDGRSEHVIAVRYSCATMSNLTTGIGEWFTKRPFAASFGRVFYYRTTEYGVGFGIKIGELKQAIAEHVAFKSQVTSSLARVTLYFIIGFIHLLLYWFYPRQRANLFFGLFGSLLAAGTLSVYLGAMSHFGLWKFVLSYFVSNALLLSGVACLLAFLYTAFPPAPPKGLLILTVGTALLIFGLLFNLPAFISYLWAVPLLFESVRVLSRAIWKNVEGAWVIGVGILLFVISIFLVGVTAQRGGIPGILRFLQTLPLLLSISIYLARNVASTSRDLEVQLAQVKQLSAAALEHEKVKAENDRRAKELEEARQLQLSMLPKKLPQLPQLDIAAYMQTASEVGGDYYDFHMSEDGTLTVAIGDATGHGLKAGTMVAAVKSLFVTLAYHPDIPHIFTRMSQTLKQMQMRGVFMALAMVKYSERQMSVSIAGMPPMMLYRHSSSTVERINLTGLPLGSVTSYRYREMTTELQPGDVLLMLSDGLTELFNPADELFGEERVEQCLQACAQVTPEEIIACLLAEAERWAEGRKLDDDLTLVVLKAK